MVTTKPIHKTVLTQEVVEHLNLKPGGTYVDATFGLGGHTAALLQAEPQCTVIALEWDKTIIEKDPNNIQSQFGDRLKVLWGNFAHIYRLLKKAKITSVDGVLADFGTSQYQITHRAGFSFSKDTPLDMRMSTAHSRITAYTVVNKYTEKQLVDIFSTLGEERYSKRIARAIVVDRKGRPLKTTGELAALIQRVTPRQKIVRIHPATRVFQAIRIHVNHELENIEQFLSGALSVLAHNGRLACISFHSLEDRIVKTFLKKHAETLEAITKKPLTASPEEREKNPSSRSAKLRVARKIKRTRA